MNPVNSDLPKDAASPVKVEEPSAPAKPKFDTHSELSDRAGTDTIIVPPGKTPRQALLEQAAREFEEALASPALEQAAQVVSEKPFCETLGISVSSAPQTLVRETLCPRCRQPLMNVASLGVCRNCGYCHALEEARSVAITDRTLKPRLLSIRNLLFLWDRIVYLHEWLVLLFAGMTAAVFVSYLANRFLTPDSGARAMWTTLQMTVGLVAVAASQVWAYRIVTALYSDGAQISPLSPWVWIGVARQLPKSGGPTYAWTWGLTLTLTAVLMVGGLGYWSNADSAAVLETRPKTKAKATKPKEQAVADAKTEKPKEEPNVPAKANQPKDQPESNPKPGEAEKTK
jgi:hypothetical protein